MPAISVVISVVVSAVVAIAVRVVSDLFAVMLMFVSGPRRR